MLGIGATSVARARECRLELALDHRLDELAHPVAHAGFDRIKPIVEKIDSRLGCRTQNRRRRAIVDHGVVSTGAPTPGLFGFQHSETTPPSIPTTPRTAPNVHIKNSVTPGEGECSGQNWVPAFAGKTRRLMPVNHLNASGH